MPVRHPIPPRNSIQRVSVEILRLFGYYTFLYHCRTTVRIKPNKAGDVRTIFCELVVPDINIAIVLSNDNTLPRNVEYQGREYILYRIYKYKDLFSFFRYLKKHTNNIDITIPHELERRIIRLSHHSYKKAVKTYRMHCSKNRRERRIAYRRSHEVQKQEIIAGLERLYRKGSISPTYYEQKMGAIRFQNFSTTTTKQ